MNAFIKDLGLTEQQALWFCYQRGRREVLHSYGCGRDTMREIWARWMSMGFPYEGWKKLELEVLKRAFPLTSTPIEIELIVMKIITGCNCPDEFDERVKRIKE